LFLVCSPPPPYPFLKEDTDFINIMKTNKSIMLYIIRVESSDATVSRIQ